MEVRQICFIGCALELAFAAPAFADWGGKAEAGLVVASGNTETETANAKLRLENEIGAWKHGFGGSALYASDEVSTTAERWEVFGQSDYSFSPRTFWFGAARYEQDEFSGFEYQATVSTGLGRKFIDSAATTFSGTVGVGYKFFETRDAFDETTGLLLEEGVSDSETILRGTLDFEHQFTPTTTLVDKFIVEAGPDNTYAENELALQVRINAVLALAVGYSVRHNTDPPAGFEKTDTLTTVNLVYEMK
jgi:putative salt-induced outer membrane protein